ncbi:MAG: hypothetical protein AB7S86_16990 [Hydrogenophaga sp.]
MGAEHWQAGTAMTFCACAGEGRSSKPPVSNINKSNALAAESKMVLERR